MIEIDSSTPCPLPTDPVLRIYAEAMEAGGQGGWIVDNLWRTVFFTNEWRIGWASRDSNDLPPVLVDAHLFSPQAVAMSSKQRFGVNRPELWRVFFAQIGGMVLADQEGGAEALKAEIDPLLHDLVDDLEPVTDAAVNRVAQTEGPLGLMGFTNFLVRIRDESGASRGVACVCKPTMGMSAISGLTSGWDPRVIDRVERITHARRRPAALLFSDLEGSSSLAANLPSASYFALVRRLIRATDRCIIEAGGIVGRHVGDGVVAFFPAEISGSESAAVRACINAARMLKNAVEDVAIRSGLTAEQVQVRCGLHWGSTLYMGRISTAARTEVAALGDEVNESARIEACATGGRTLASKTMLERLEPEDAKELGLDLTTLSYIRLRDMATATEKARKDAPAITVCEI